MSITDKLKRAKAAEKKWQLWRSLHQEAMDFSSPQRETWNEYSPGQRKNRHVYDSTAVIGSQQFANRIQSSLMPPWVQWMNLAPGEDIPEDDADQAKKLLEKATDDFFSALNHSNFYTEIAPGLTDLAVGTGGLLVEEGEFGKEEAVRFVNVPLAELYPEDTVGSIDNVWRKKKISPRNIQKAWPMAKLTPKLQEMADKPDPKDVIIWIGQLYNRDTGKYELNVIYEDEKAMLYEAEFNTKRLIVFRWHVTPGENFGRGPIIQMLPDIRTANIIKEYMLKNAAIQMSGVYTGVSDGIFNPHTVRIRPGSVIPVASNSGNPSLMPLTPSGNIGLGEAMLSDLQNSIRKALFSDPLGDITDPTKTATEIMIRNQEMLKDAGASFGRLKTELIEPLISAVVDILVNLGRMPDIRIDGREVKVKHESPLAKSEKMEDFQNWQVWMSSQAQFLPPEVLMATNKVEDFPKLLADLLGVNTDFFRTDEERAKLTQQLTQMGGQPIE